MTLKELAIKIAEEFNKDIEVAECEDFEEMKALYDWTAKDIKAEIEYMVNRAEYGEDEHGEPIYSGCLLMDSDVENINDVHDCMKYGQFKKLIFANVK